MAVCTSSPARACRARVPPHPSTSSSGWAAITRTRLTGRFIVAAPAFPRPWLLAQRPAPQHGAIVCLELEQHDRALSTGHQLPAGGCERAHDGAEHRARRARVAGPIRARDPGRVPHGPAPPVEPAERAGVGARERAHEVVHGTARLAPID